jgi:hypothetical protein
MRITNHKMFSRSKYLLAGTALILGLAVSMFGALLMPQKALALGERFTWAGDLNITGTNGDFAKGNPASISFSRTAAATDTNVYVYNGSHRGTQDYNPDNPECTARYQISVTLGTAPSYSATIRNLDARCGSKTLNGTINITGTAPAAVTRGTGSTDPGAGNTGTPSTPEGDQESPECKNSATALTFIFCPIIDGIIEFSDWMLEDVIQPLLRTKPVSLDADAPMYKIWSAFRVYGNIILVIALLFAVFGTAISAGVFEAYTARKMLPRILLSAILINVSIYIVAFAADMSNIIGFAIGDLIISPVQNSALFTFTPTGLEITTSLLAGFGGIGIVGGFFAILIWGSGLTAFMMWVGLFILLPVILTVLGIFLTIVLLHGIIFTLVISSPVAFAFYCLPNTEKYFRTWWDWLFKALLVYPIVMAIFAIADVLSVAVNFGNDTGGNTSFWAQSTNLVAGIISFLLLFIPLAMIPFAFKLAGGLIGRITDLVANYKSKTAEGIKGNPNDPYSLRNMTRRRLNNALTAGQARLVDQSRKVDKFGRGTASWQTKTFAGASRLFAPFIDERLARQNKEARDLQESMSETGRDQLRYAAAGFRLKAGEVAPSHVRDGAGTTTNYDRFYDSKGRYISETLYKEGKSTYGRTPTEMSQSFNYTTRKVQNDQDIANMRYAFERNAVDNNWTQDEANDVWAAAVFQYKPLLGGEWYSKPKIQKNASGKTTGVKYEDLGNHDSAYWGFAEELHKTRESFKLASVRDQDWRAMAQRQRDYQGIIDTKGVQGLTKEQFQNYAMTQEIIDSVVRRGMSAGVSFNAEGEPMISGVSPASEGVLKALIKNRKYRSTHHTDPTTGASVDQRVLYNDAAVAAKRKVTPPGAFDEEAEIRANILKDAYGQPVHYEVTGDEQRSTIPK